MISVPEQVNVFNAGLIREHMLAVIGHGAAVLIGDMTDTLSCDNAGAEAIAHVYQRALASGTAIARAPAAGSTR